MAELARLHPVSRDHLDVLTDDIGIHQHAEGSRPDPVHGYCVDDVARALQVDLLHQRDLGWAAVADRAGRNLRFLVEAFDHTTGRFRNFRRIDGSWIGGIGSEDCQGRAILALGETIAAAPDQRLVAEAAALLELALPATHGFLALRAQSSIVLGCDAAMRAARRGRNGAVADTFRMLARRLQATFDQPAASPWPWPEPRLTYENALPVRALIVAGQRLGTPRTVAVGVRVLDWLIRVQTAPDGHFSPIGNTWWTNGGAKPRFDQQPIEATALLLAAETAYQVTGKPRHRLAMERAYAWFLGANDLGIDVAVPRRGAGFDGLTPLGVNTNQGAESTLMWLIALEHMRSLRRGSQPAAHVAPTSYVAIAS